MYFIDYVGIGGDKQEISQLEIEWLGAAENNPKKTNALFDSYSPFDICEKNFAIRNMLIIFQSLSQHPWILRKMVQSDRSKSNFYNVNLYINYAHKLISVDHHVPYLADKNEPMFMSDTK